ncbi:zinc ion binding protein, partial [Genlisea aurea]
LIPNVVSYENSTLSTGQHIELSRERRTFLGTRGHRLKPVSGGAMCQLVVQNFSKSNDRKRGRLVAVSDPRKGGRPAGGMNLGGLSKVWEIRALKRKPREEEARKILDRIAKQVQPIMARHNWRVKMLSEFWPKNGALLGLNVGSGIHVKLRLRRANNDQEFLPFHDVLDTMLHELCHNAHGPHNASFYKLWDDIRKECEDLMNRGIAGSGKGFDLPGRRLGGYVPRNSSLHRAAFSAAENRARLGKLLPSGPKKIGGDSSIMTALSPIQAAAMAAERRLRDNLWCGSEFCDETTLEDDENRCCSDIPTSISTDDDNVSRKRRRESDESAGHKQEQPPFIDLTRDVSKSGEARFTQRSSSSSSESESWQCSACTLFNPPLAPICGLCATRKRKDGSRPRMSLWTCRFCTYDNEMETEKCVVCEAWRYSRGPPMASSSPYVGT